MPQAHVGYKLIASNGDTIKEWGGSMGHIPDPPNPLKLPNGDHVHAPSLDIDYAGYRLVKWYIDYTPEPEVPVGPVVPHSVTPRQLRLTLLNRGLLDSVEAMITLQDKATQLSWEYATEFRREDPLLNQLAVGLNLTNANVDEMFIEAAGY